MEYYYTLGWLTTVMVTLTPFRYYINYKLMKKKVKQYVQQIEVSEQSREYVLKDFSRVLDKQV